MFNANLILVRLLLNVSIIFGIIQGKYYFCKVIKRNELARDGEPSRALLFGQHFVTINHNF